jgi:hypothetical protein
MRERHFQITALETHFYRKLYRKKISSSIYQILINPETQILDIYQLDQRSIQTSYSERHCKSRLKANCNSDSIPNLDRSAAAGYFYF